MKVAVETFSGGFVAKIETEDVTTMEFKERLAFSLHIPASRIRLYISAIFNDGDPTELLDGEMLVGAGVVDGGSLLLLISEETQSIAPARRLEVVQSLCDIVRERRECERIFGADMDSLRECLLQIVSRVTVPVGLGEVPAWQVIGTKGFFKASDAVQGCCFFRNPDREVSGQFHFEEDPTLLVEVAGKPPKKIAVKEVLRNLFSVHWEGEEMMRGEGRAHLRMTCENPRCVRLAHIECDLDIDMDDVAPPWWSEGAESEMLGSEEAESETNRSSDEDYSETQDLDSPTHPDHEHRGELMQEEVPDFGEVIVPCVRGSSSSSTPNDAVDNGQSSSNVHADSAEEVGFFQGAIAYLSRAAQQPASLLFGSVNPNAFRAQCCSSLGFLPEVRRQEPKARPKSRGGPNSLPAEASSGSDGEA